MTAQLRPRRLAVYIAISAAMRRSCAVWQSPPIAALPAEAVMVSLPAEVTNGWAEMSVDDPLGDGGRPIAGAEDQDAELLTPQRATSSPSRAAAVSRPANARRTSSPTT